MSQDSFIPVSGTNGMPGGDCTPLGTDSCAGEAENKRFLPVEHPGPIFGSGRRR